MANAELPKITHAGLARLLALWDAKRGARHLPARTDFDVAELKPWLGNIMLIDVLEGGREFRYRVYGSVLASYYGPDLTGETTIAVRPEARELVRTEYREVCRTRRPLVIMRERNIEFSTRLTAKLVLPLSANDEDVDMLLVTSYPV